MKVFHLKNHISKSFLLSLILIASLFLNACSKSDSAQDSAGQEQSQTQEAASVDTQTAVDPEAIEATASEPIAEEMPLPMTLETDQDKNTEDSQEQTETDPPADAETDDVPFTVDVFGVADGLYSKYAYMITVDTGEIFLNKGGSDRIFPASMTKIMTAVVAIENLADLDERITITQEQIDQLYAEEASLAGFEAGESVSVRDLLYGVMLPSGAECCMALADRIAGSEDGFVELMNQKAQELGMANTHFVTDSGLHNDDHYTTCEDMANLLRYALQSDTFRSVFTAHSYVTEADDYYTEGLYMGSTLFDYVESDTLDNGAVLEGGKTGYTDEAQQCLASLASFNGREFILVTAYAVGNHETEQFHILDALHVYGMLY